MLWPGPFSETLPSCCSTNPRPTSTAGTEADVLDAVSRLAAGRTVVLVAHRPALLSIADRVVDLTRTVNLTRTGVLAVTGGVSGTGRTETWGRWPGRTETSRTMPAGPGQPDGGRPTSATWRSPRSGAPWPWPARRRLLTTTLLSAGTAGCGVALLATSAWLISRAAQRPSVVALGAAIIGVRFFAVSRASAVTANAWSATMRPCASWPSCGSGSTSGSRRLAPTGLPAFRRGDLLARLVEDVDALQDLLLRVIPPYGVALLVSIPTVGLIWYFLPSAGLVLARRPCAAAAASSRGTPATWPAGGNGRLAAIRGELSTHVVDLLDGAADLLAFGAVDAQLARVSAADAELSRIATSTARAPPALGSGLITLLTGMAVWGILLVGVPAVHSGRLTGRSSPSSPLSRWRPFDV